MVGGAVMVEIRKEDDAAGDTMSTLELHSIMGDHIECEPWLKRPLILCQQDSVSIPSWYLLKVGTVVDEDYIMLRKTFNG